MYADDTKIFRHILCKQDSMKLQYDMDSVYNWLCNWSLELHIEKCKVVSYGRHEMFDNLYHLDNSTVEKVDSIKDLGVIFDCKLKFDIHINDKINKANRMLGIIKRNFKFLCPDAFVMLYKSLIRSHLEYPVTVWSPHRKDDRKIRKVQMRATKLIYSIRHVKYCDRLESLNLPALKFKRLRGDMIEIYKILTGKCKY